MRHYPLSAYLILLSSFVMLASVFVLSGPAFASSLDKYRPESPPSAVYLIFETDFIATPTYRPTSIARWSSLSAIHERRILPPARVRKSYRQSRQPHVKGAPILI